MNGTNYTVSELTERLGAKSPRQRDLQSRRLRHWTTLGVLETNGQHHTGTGRARRYSSEALYLAAVLLAVADWGMPISTITAMARCISAERKRNPEFERLWQEAKAKGPKLPGADGKRGSVGLALAVETDEDGQIAHVGVSIGRGENALELPGFRFEGPGPDLHILDLDLLFSRVNP